MTQPSRIRVWRTLALATIAAIALAGCASSPASMPFGWPDDLVEVSQSSPDAPSVIRDGDPVHRCSVIVLEPGELAPSEAFDCLNERFETGAELVVVTPTTEGDPTVTYYRVGPGIDGVNIYSDMTSDRFGGGWHIQHCPTTTDVKELSGCVEQ